MRYEEVDCGHCRGGGTPGGRGTAARAVPVTIQGRWRHYVWGNGEDAFLGGYDGGIFLDGERLASNLPFPDGSSAYTCLKDMDRNLVLLANRKLQYMLVRLPWDSADGGAMARLVVPAASQAEADAVLAASLFHFGEITIPQLKEYLAGKGIPVRR